MVLERLPLLVMITQRRIRRKSLMLSDKAKLD
jgi:hypothetical protein